MNLLYSELIDPISGEELKYSHEHNTLISTRETYQIFQGIPVFVPEKNFEDHWELNATETIPKSKILESENFLTPLIDLARTENFKILDAGCGDGIHLLSLQKKSISKDLTGIDLSLQALRLCQLRLNENSSLVQGNILNLPFKDNHFDAVYSYGVLGYTDDPKESFQQLVKKTKRKGLIGIWLFPETKGMAGLAFNMARKWCRITGKLGTALLANLIVPFLGLLPTRSKLSLLNANWKQCREVVLVNIAPSQLYLPDKEEIIDWFNEEKVKILHDDESNPITIWGVKE